MTLTVAPLTPATWGAFADLAQRHNGVWGGCWCLAFHPEGADKGLDPDDRRAAKEARVQAGAAHAALVMDGARALGWCQFGPPAELPRIKHRRAIEAAGRALPDWRITCFFVDKAARGRGIAALALEGALAQIAAAGGGRVEAGPEDVAGRKVGAAFLWGGGLAMYDRAGFERVRPIGKHHWLVAKDVAGA